MENGEAVGRLTGITTKKIKSLSFIIGKSCIGIKDGACIDACPVDCIHIGEKQMYIDPEECIDCGACVPECPVEAIFEDEQEAIECWRIRFSKRQIINFLI